MSTPSKRTVPKDGVVQPGDHPQRRRLARAVGAEQRDDLALIDRDREVVQGRDGAVADLHACHLEQCHQSASCAGVVFAVGCAQVGVDHDRVLLDLGRRALRDHLAEVEHDDPLRHRHHELHVVLDQQHGDAQLGAHLADQLPELDLLGRVGPRRGLVQQQHLGLGPECPARSRGAGGPRRAASSISRSPRLVSPTNFKSSSVLRSPSCSSRRVRGNRSMAPTGPVCCLDSTPIFTFSNVVNALNIREVWKVLATPSRFTL